MALLGRRELLNALEELDQELGILNVRGEVFIVGGAAMAIAYDTRRATSDVDAVFVPSSEVRTAASRVAEKLNLEPDWLNDGAKAFLPGEDKDRIGVYEGQHLSVAAASPQYLLAMKLMASRVERDQDDIRELYKLLWSHDGHAGFGSFGVLLSGTSDIAEGTIFAPRNVS